MHSKSRVPFDLSQIPAYLEKELEAFAKEINGYATKRWVPIWTGAGGNPTIGNGSLVSRYRLSNDLCELWLRLVIGSTTTLGTGAWSFSLPVKALENNQIGDLAILDSGTTWYVGASLALSASPTLQGITHNNGIQVGAASPMAWAANDVLYAHIRYLR